MCTKVRLISSVCISYLGFPSQADISQLVPVHRLKLQTIMESGLKTRDEVTAIRCSCGPCCQQRQLRSPNSMPLILAIIQAPSHSMAEPLLASPSKERKKKRSHESKENRCGGVLLSPQ